MAALALFCAWSSELHQISGSIAFSRRSYFTVIQLSLAAIVMFFMSLTSAYIVRKGLNNDWQATPLPPVHRHAEGDHHHRHAGDDEPREPHGARVRDDA